MKTHFLLVILLFKSFSTFSQNVENPGFDSAYIGGIDRIYAWVTSDAWSFSIIDTVQPLNPSTHYVSTGLSLHKLLTTTQLEYQDCFDGPLAIKLFCDSNHVKSDGSAYPGFIINGNHFYTSSAGYLDISKSGMPFTHRPTKLRGHFKFQNDSPSLSNYGKAIVLLKKYNSILNKIDTVGIAESTVELYETTNWTSFEIPINYQSTLIPDSIVVYFQASAGGLNSTLWLDSLGFIYPGPSLIQEAAPKELPFYYDAQAQSIIFINQLSPASVSIVNTSGAILFNGRTDNPVSIASFPVGIYFLNFNYNNFYSRIYKILR